MVLEVIRLRISAASIDRFICPNNNTEIMVIKGDTPSFFL